MESEIDKQLRVKQARKLKNESDVLLYISRQAVVERGGSWGLTQTVYNRQSPKKSSIDGLKYRWRMLDNSAVNKAIKRGKWVRKKEGIQTLLQQMMSEGNDIPPSSEDPPTCAMGSGISKEHIPTATFTLPVAAPPDSPKDLTATWEREYHASPVLHTVASSSLLPSTAPAEEPDSPKYSSATWEQGYHASLLLNAPAQTFLLPSTALPEQLSSLNNTTVPWELGYHTSPVLDTPKPTFSFPSTASVLDHPNSPDISTAAWEQGDHTTVNASEGVFIDSTSAYMLEQPEYNVLDYTSTASFADNFMTTTQTGGDSNGNMLDITALWTPDHLSASTFECDPVNTPLYMPTSTFGLTTAPALDPPAQGLFCNLPQYELARETTCTIESPMFGTYYNTTTIPDFLRMGSWYLGEEAQPQFHHPTEDSEPTAIVNGLKLVNDPFNYWNYTEEMEEVNP